MGQRHDAIGIKQVIRLEWLERTTNLLLAGLDVTSLRLELHEYLAARTGSGAASERGATSRTQVVNMLIRTWRAPDQELRPLRDAFLEYLRQHPAMKRVIHWGMIGAAYPFWFNAAQQTGRLLALQDQVTQAQIIQRLKEQYGDRQTVSRYARSVIRSFVMWGALQDLAGKGSYEKNAPINIPDPRLAALMLEAALHALSDGRGTLGRLLNNPAFFPFTFPAVTGDLVSRYNERIELVRYGLDEELLKLKA